mmetsp:Transcript_6160/g.19344  ORF Transcript_6160/g.19344 Transcript_6160/m.19344 type:complete len:218 (+) Transcript_6160:912-1565(+)
MYSTCGGGGIDAFVLPSLSMLSFKGIGVGDLANKRFRSRASSLVFCFFTKFSKSATSAGNLLKKSWMRAEDETLLSRTFDFFDASSAAAALDAAAVNKGAVFLFFSGAFSSSSKSSQFKKLVVFLFPEDLKKFFMVFCCVVAFLYENGSIGVTSSFFNDMRPLISAPFFFFSSQFFSAAATTSGSNFSGYRIPTISNISSVPLFVSFNEKSSGFCSC